MKVETTETDHAGKLTTKAITVSMDRPWTLTRRVLLHGDKPYNYYDYAGDSPGSLPKHGFVLAKNGAGGTTNSTTENVTAEITPCS